MRLFSLLQPCSPATLPLGATRFSPTAMMRGWLVVVQVSRPRTRAMEVQVTRRRIPAILDADDDRTRLSSRLRCCIADYFAIFTRIVAKLNSYWISNGPAISVHPAEQSIGRAITPIATTDC